MSRAGIEIQAQRMGMGTLWGGGRLEGGANWEIRNWEIMHTPPHVKIDGQWDPVIKHGELSSVLCDGREGWDGGRLTQRGHMYEYS